MIRKPTAFPAAVCLAALLFLSSPNAFAADYVAVAKDGKGFVLSPSGKPFTPWGFNYDRDYKFRLIEDYWLNDWPAVEQNFAEMKKLGANVVRVHLQFGQFMKSPAQPNEENLQQLEKLVNLAEKTGLYLDITGLGCYRKADIPPWYDGLPESDRWAAQARFWEAVARTCADHPAVWCYDLMNEPVVAGEKRTAWLHPQALDNLYFLQFVNLDPAGRPRSDIARQWTHQMAAAIRKYDARHMITIGLVLIDLGKPEDAAGFAPARLASELDFVSVHVYPKAGQLGQSTAVLERCRQTGKPVVIEEIFPLKCDVQTLGDFLAQSRGLASGWLGFFWGQTPEELKLSPTPADQLTLQWLELFERMNPNR